MNWIDERVEQLIVVFDDGYSRPTFGQVDFFKKSITEAHTKGTQEALAKVEEWVKEKKSTKVFKLVDRYEPLSVEKITIPDGLDSAFYLGEHITLDDLLHHLQQLKDKKGV